MTRPRETGGRIVDPALSPPLGAGAAHAGDEGVGHHLAAGALVARGAGAVGGPCERRERGDAVLHRQQGGQVGHRVRRRSQGHPALGLGPAAPGDQGGRVEPRDLPQAGADELTLAHRLQGRGIPGDDLGPPSSRSASERQAVSRATMVAFHSVMWPVRQAAHVCGSSRATTFASPRC